MTTRDRRFRIDLDAKALFPGLLRLWTFRANESARRFFRAGLRDAELTNGADNDERLPDIRMVWEAAA